MCNLNEVSRPSELATDRFPKMDGTIAVGVVEGVEEGGATGEVRSATCSEREIFKGQG